MIAKGLNRSDQIYQYILDKTQVIKLHQFIQTNNTVICHLFKVNCICFNKKEFLFELSNTYKIFSSKIYDYCERNLDLTSGLFCFFFSVEIQSLFKTFDKNNDKYISSDELGKAMRFLGLNVTKKDVDEAMKVLDKNGMNCLHFRSNKRHIFITLKQCNASGQTKVINNNIQCMHGYTCR